MSKRRLRRYNATGRSEGGEQFLALAYGCLNSPAWRSLSGAAVKVYLEIRSRYNGHNNGKISLSLEEGAKLLGLGKATVARALAELQEKGFLVLRKQGHWYGRKASEYEVTDRPRDGYPATHAWKAWQPPKNKPRFSGGPYLSPDGPVSEP